MIDVEERSFSGRSRTATSGRLGISTTRKTTLTAAITKVLAEAGGRRLCRLTRSTRRRRSGRAGSRSRRRTSSTRRGQPARYAHVDWPGARRLHQEHDHRGGPDGWRDPGGVGGGRADAADPRAHLLLARQVGVPAVGGVHEQGFDMVDDPWRRCWTWSSWRCASCCRVLPVPGGRHPGGAGLGAGGLGGARPGAGA